MVNGQPVGLEAGLTDALLADEQLTEAVGAELWRRLTAGPIGAALEPIAFTEQIRLDLRSTELERLPWELLRSNNRWLFSWMGSRWSLGHGGAPPVGAPTALSSPVRILVIVGNDPDDVLQSDGELLRIEAAANAHKPGVLLSTLIRPSPAQVRDELIRFRPHVLHFIGHGKIINGRPEVLVNRGPGQNDRWNAEQVSNVFVEAPPPIVVLNACFSGTTQAATRDLPRAFTDVGTMAVVAMTQEILAEAASGFSEAFYTQLLAGLPVDAAVTEARRALLTVVDAGPGGNQARIKRSWPLVRVIVHGDDVPALPVPEQVVTCGLTDDFVARWKERFDLCRIAEAGGSRLTLLVGGMGAGRSEMLRFVSAAHALRGGLVLMVPLDVDRSGQWTELVKQIAEAADAEPEIDATELTAIAGRINEDDDFREFVAALERCCPNRELLLAIDGLGRWQSNVVDFVLSGLCHPFLEPRPGSTVRVAVTLVDPNTTVPFDMTAEEGLLRVGDFRPDEWERAVNLFLDQLSNGDPDHRALLENLCRVLTEIDGPKASVLDLSRSKARQLQRAAAGGGGQ